MEMCWVFLPCDTTGMWRSSLMNTLPLCGRVYCHCSYCCNLGMASFWLTSCRNHICFRKIMLSISLIVTWWLRNSDFPGLQNGGWILCVGLSNSWTHSCNPLGNQQFLLCVQLRFWGCLVFIYEGNYDNLPKATEHAFAFRVLVSLA